MQFNSIPQQPNIDNIACLAFSRTVDKRVLYLAYSRGGSIYQKHCHTSPVSILSVLYGIGALDVGFSIYQYRSENIGHNLAYFFGLF